MITAAFNWWVDGLAATWLGLEARFRRARRFRVAGIEGPFVLKPLDSSGGEAAGPIEITESMTPDALLQIRQATCRSVFEVIVPPAALLERRLEPLPRESKPYIESVVRHQIETIFPWNARDILHTALVDDRGDGKIDVTVRATSRSAIEPVLSLASLCEASEVIVTSSGERDRAAIRVPLNEDALGSRKRGHAVARYAVLVLLLSGLCAIGWASFARWSMTSELAMLDQAITDRRALMMRTSASGDAAGRDGLEAKRLQTPLAVLVLEKLSELLPDDTYLTDLSVDGERLRITGVSGQAAELVPLLERAGHFRNAAFYAPTTRMSGRSSDRFSIEAVVNLQPEAKR
jgi:general secretion pathway protein L